MYVNLTYKNKAQHNYSGVTRIDFNINRLIIYRYINHGNTEMAQIMINDEGIDVNIGSTNGGTPLIFALEEQNINVSLLLIKNVDKCKIDLNATFNGLSVLD